jgi:excisionase family DNA binding protein
MLPQAAADCKRIRCAEGGIFKMNQTERRLHGRLDAAQQLNVSLRCLDELLATRQLASIKIGKRRLIPTEAIERFIRQREKAERGQQ